MISQPRLIPRLAAFIVPIVLSTGCAEMFPSKVATGIARLTMRNLAAIAGLIIDDTTCGFESEAVKANARVEGEVGDIGRVTWIVDQCTLRPRNQVVTTDCNGVSTIADGEVKVSATQTIEGYITGDPETPVIPLDAGSAVVNILNAEAVDLRVESSHSLNVLTINEGSLSGKVLARLIADKNMGVCSLTTSILSFEDVVWGDSVVSVESPSMSFGAHVNGSNLRGQNGRWQSDENTIEGTLTVWGGEQLVPDDGLGLDPTYDPVIFQASYACLPDMVYPATHQCDLDVAFGENAARLSVQTLAGLVSAVNSDTACGFASTTAQLTTTGETGRPGGTAVQAIQGCVLEFAQPTVLSTDCQGVETVIQGRAVISGTKTVYGVLTGDPLEPAIPVSRDGAVLSISADLTDLEIIAGGTGLRVRTGQLAGTVQPRTAIDTETNACSIATPVAELSGIQWTNADAHIVSGAMTLGVYLESSNLYAINGRKGYEVNHLSGSINVNGQPLDFADLRLNPSYDPEAFDAAYTCVPNQRIPASDSECDFTKALAQGAARLVIKTFGNTVVAADADPVCGFASIDGIVPGAVGASPGDMMTAMWDIVNCEVGNTVPKHLSTDCNGKQTFIEGSARVTATKSVTGQLAIDYPPIYPQDRTSARFDVHQINLTEFSVKEYLPGSAAPEAHMIVHSAILSGISTPITAEAEEVPGAYFVAVPVAQFDNVRITEADVSVVVGPKQFRLHLNSSNLDAFNGSWNGRTNDLSGLLTMAGETLAVPVSPHDMGLDPAYDQAAFDSSYACNEEMAAPIPAASP